MGQDTRIAARALVKTPGFSLVAVAIIAIGIGANTAVFSVVDAALLRPLPFRHADRLFMLGATNPTRGIVDGPFSYPAYVELGARQRTLGGLAAFAYDRFNATGGERPEQLAGARVSWTFFDVLGVDLSAGRAFIAADDRPGAPGVVVIGRRYWARAFGGNAAAIGATLTLNGAPYTVVGVVGIEMPPPFDGVDVWTTRVNELSGFTSAQIDGGLGYLTAVARLPDLARVEAVQAELDAIAHGYARAHPANTDADPGASLRLVPMRDRVVGTARPPLVVMMGAVGLVLLIACANVSNLLLVRATARAHDAAVRAALGASRWELVRWLASESLLIALAGGVAGVLLAFWGVGLAASALRDLPRASEIAVNGRVLAFSCAVSATAALVFGIAPSAFALRQSPVDALRTGGRTTGSGRGPRRLLVVAEVAVSLVLLVGAALLAQSFSRLTHVAVGFNPSNLLTLRVSLPSSRYPTPASMRTFIARAIRRLETTPGVASAAASMALPPAVTTMAPYQAGDRATVGIGERPVGQWSATTPGYFATMGIPLVAGRTISERDDENASLVVVISRELARRAWPNESAVGKKLLVGRFPGFAEVVGVVGDVKNAGLGRDPVVAMYTPYAQRPWPAMQFAVRAASGGEGSAIAASVAAAFRDVDPDLPLTGVGTMNDALSESISTERLIAVLVGGFAAVALVLAAAGLYGVLAYTVVRRTREIGVRVALGADSRAIVRLIASEGLTLAAIGMLAGTVAAAAGARALRAVLFEVSPADPITYASVLLVFGVTACAAFAMPARRAARIDPIEALRTD